MKHVIGIDLGGTKVEACLLDSERNLVERKRDFSNVDKGIPQLVEKTMQLVHEVSGGRKIEAVGMGTGGTYDPETDLLLGLPHTPSFENPGFIQSFREKFFAPLIIENDANCLAIAEYFASCEGKYDYVMAVIIGTGMGAGLILDKKLFKGAYSRAGEIGHNSIDINGRLCECGSKGCAEAYLSGRSISRRYFELTGKKIDVPAIYELYKNGEEDTIPFFEETCRIMGRIFANAINTLDIEAIILGGGVSNLPIWYSEVSPIIRKNMFGAQRKEIPIIQAKLGDSAGVVGAAYLALREIGIMNF